MKVYYDQHRLKEMARQSAINKIDLEVSRMKGSSRKVPTKHIRIKDDASRVSSSSNARRLQSQIQKEKSRRRKLEGDVQSVRSVLESQLGALSQLNRA